MAQYILSATANILHYIQLLVVGIWQYVEKESHITHDIIDKNVLRVLGMKSDYYMDLFDRQSKSKKQLLLELCSSGKNIFSEAYIKNTGCRPLLLYNVR